MSGTLLAIMSAATAAYWAWLKWRHPRDNSFKLDEGSEEGDGASLRDVLLLSFSLGLCAAAAGVHFAPLLELIPALKVVPWAAAIFLCVIIPLLFWWLERTARVEEMKQLLLACEEMARAAERQAEDEAKRRRDDEDEDPGQR